MTYEHEIAETIREAAPRSFVDDLNEVIAHLGAAKSQIIASDDQIIANHVRSALVLSQSLLRRVRGQ